jgi:UDP-N-acetylglucosamine 2-epimerase
VTADVFSVRKQRKPRILIVFGTRPEAIKIAPVALGLRERGHEFETVLCSTGQHRDMLDQGLAAFGLRPDVDLRLMAPQQTLAALTTRALSAVHDIVSRVEPDMVIVQGDTTSAMVGALAAYYHRLPVAHLEAGLRTSDLYRPFPEEGNRRLIGSLAALHFAPTPRAAGSLRAEAVPDSRILVTGNTGIDALLHMRNRVSTALDPASRGGRRRILLTIHRRESMGAPIENICTAVLQLVERNPEVEVVCPVHASPLVREPVHRLLGHHPRVTLLEPLGYQEFVRVLDSSCLVMTDSGGVQEEAPALGKPVLVLRDKTERPEGVVVGAARLVGTDTSTVLHEAETLLHDSSAYMRMARAVSCYGDGRATERVVGALRRHFGITRELPDAFDPGLAAPQIARTVEILEEAIA